MKARAGGEEMVSSSSHTTAVAGRLSSKTTVPVAASGSLDCTTAPDAEHGLVGLREATAPAGEHQVGRDVNIDVCTILSTREQCHATMSSQSGR